MMLKENDCIKVEDIKMLEEEEDRKKTNIVKSSDEIIKSPDTQYAQSVRETSVHRSSSSQIKGSLSPIQSPNI